MPAVAQLHASHRMVFMTRTAPPIGSRSAQLTCASCNLRELCLPGGCLDDVVRF